MYHGLSKLGTVYFNQWGNGEPLTYDDFPVSYNLQTYSGEHCGAFEYFNNSYTLALNCNFLQYRNKIWGDYPCDGNIPYVCEFNPGPTEICKAGNQLQIIVEIKT